MNNENETTEYMIEKLFDLKHKGQSESEIVRAFPKENEREVRSYLETMNLLATQIETIEVPENGLRAILEANQQASEKGFIKSPFSKNFFGNYGMILTAGMTLALIVVIGVQKNQDTITNFIVSPKSSDSEVALLKEKNNTSDSLSLYETEPSFEDTMAMSKMSAPASTPSGNIDEAMAEFEQVAVAEKNSSKTEARDKELASYDSEEISKFNQYNDEANY